MILVAFTLGLLGSLHCVGMCGPLAIAFTHRPGQSKKSHLYAALSYNIGRTITYALIGSLFGVIGSLVAVVEMQKLLSIILGLIMVISFLLSIDLEGYINKNTWLKNQYFKLRNILSSMMQKSQEYSPFVLGMVNGLLPCGLVYLALAGALATGNIAYGMLFMIFFGLGTIPMLLAIVLGYEFVSGKWRMQFRRALPYVTLCFGLFLIYRGLVVDMPAQLGFWEALKNPIMCH